MSSYRARQAQVFRQIVARYRSEHSDKLFYEAIARVLTPAQPESVSNRERRHVSTVLMVTLPGRHSQPASLQARSHRAVSV